MSMITDFFFKSTADASEEIVFISNKNGRASSVDGESGATSAAKPTLDKVAGPASMPRFYLDKTKKDAIRYALENGIAAALRKFPGIKRSTLRGWVSKAERHMKEAIEAAPEDMPPVPIDLDHVIHDGRCANGKRLPQVVFDRVYDRVQQIRGAGMVLSRATLRREVLAAATELDAGILDENGGWLTCTPKMMKRLEKELDLTRRVATTAKRGTVSDKESARQLYLARVASVCHQYAIPRSLCYHMDETGVCLLPVSNRTLAARGSKAVPVAHMEDKRQITCIIGGDFDGGVLPVQIVYGPGAKNRLPRVEGVHTTWSDSHWATFETTCQWLQDVLVPAALKVKECEGLPPEHPVLLTWDVYAAHRSKEIRDFIAGSIPWLRLVYVPANCTDFLQVADVSLNTPFKRKMRSLCETWLVDCMKAGISPDTKLRNLRIKAAEWCRDAALTVASTDAAINGIRKVGLLHVKNAAQVSKALAMAEAGHLWASASRNDIVAPRGQPATAGVSIRPPAPVVDMSDDGEETSAPRPRVQVRHCTYCKRAGHLKTSCTLLKLQKESVHKSKPKR